jgi:hypothetical protein
MYASTELLDCNGIVSHRLTLLANGNVQITFNGGATATVDPIKRVTLTPGMSVTPSLMDAAASLTPF